MTGFIEHEIRKRTMTPEEFVQYMKEEAIDFLVDQYEWSPDGPATQQEKGAEEMVDLCLAIQRRSDVGS